MNNTKEQISKLEPIVPLLESAVKDLELLRYHPFQYDSMYSSFGDAVNPHDDILKRNINKIDKLITPILKELGIYEAVLVGQNPFGGSGIKALDRSIELFQRMNFLLDPDNFPE